MLVVSDTSPITNLMKIGRLSLLRQIFKKVVIPEKVKEELFEWEKLGVDLSAFENADWIVVEQVKNIEFVEKLHNELDDGEAEV